VHGITTEYAEAVGIEEVQAIDMFMALWAGPGRLRIAHNEQFDARILRIALKRFYDKPDHLLPISDTWKEGIADCTAKLATPICQIPPTAKMLKAGFNKFKTANLSEAYRHFTGRELENAHSAIADVMACRDVYFAIQDMKGAAA